MQGINQEKCYSCDQRSPDLSIIQDIPTCRECHDQNNKMLKQWKDERISEGKIFPEVDEIIENKLYLGNEDTAVLKDKLKELKITHILVAGSSLEQRFKDDFTYHQIEIADSLMQNISQYFQETYDFIEQANVIYVHCAAGVSRSATIVIAYLMRKNSWSFAKAYKYVKEKRRVIRPNNRFQKELREYQTTLGTHVEKEDEEYDQSLKELTE